MDEILLGDRELDVMGVLWEIGSGTVAQVRERLPADLAYTTVLTILRNLERKGMVAHEVEGQAHRYTPRVARAAARRSALARLVDKLFHGAPDQLLAHMVEERTLTAADLRRLRARIAEFAREDAATAGDSADVPASDAPRPDEPRPGRVSQRLPALGGGLHPAASRSPGAFARPPARVPKTLSRPNMRRDTSAQQPTSSGGPNSGTGAPSQPTRTGMRVWW
ncbi:hypothetical protein tb265_40080 [Gemmatimonadetes bacterium T265]|nr:hypothetical protein tb265_40080 [Gemmatimonadetes bacterium T265]